jgi:hypothetical protein
MNLNLVPARTGVTWVQQGVKTFVAQPMVFFSLFMVFMTAVAFLSLVPVIGGVLGLMVIPAMTLGLMVATEQVSFGRDGKTKMATAAVFVAALSAVRQRAKSLAILGFIFALCVLAAVWLASLFDDGQLQSLVAEDGTANIETMQSAAFQLAFILRLAFYVPISLLFWHAPALVHWHGITPVKSLFFSVVACFRNFGAMTMFGVVWMLMSLAASVVLGLIGTVAVAVAGGAGGGFGAALIIGGSLALTAMFFCTNWFMFRDTFQAE